MVLAGAHLLAGLSPPGSAAEAPCVLRVLAVLAGRAVRRGVLLPAGVFLLALLHPRLLQREGVDHAGMACVLPTVA